MLVQVFATTREDTEPFPFTINKCGICSIGLDDERKNCSKSSNSVGCMSFKTRRIPSDSGGNHSFGTPFGKAQIIRGSPKGIFVIPNAFFDLLNRLMKAMSGCLTLASPF